MFFAIDILAALTEEECVGEGIERGGLKGPLKRILMLEDRYSKYHLV